MYRILCQKLGMLLLFTVFITACSSPNNDIVNEEAVLSNDSIRFISGWGGYDIKSRLLAEELSHISNEMSITIINESLDNETYMTKLKTDLVSGNSQDIFMMEPGEDLDRLISAGKVANLTTVVAQNEDWKNSFDQSLWDYVTYDDMIYGIPLEVDYQSMFVNRILFEQYNVKVPETYSELIEAIRIFNRKGITPIAFNISDSGMQLYENIVLRLGNWDEITEPMTDNTISECYIEAMFYIKDLYEMGAFPEDVFLLTDEGRDQLFLDNNAAMIINDASFIGDPMLSTNADYVEMIRFPYFDDKSQYATSIIYGLGSGTLHISQDCFMDEERRQNAFEIVKRITSEEFSLSLKMNSCAVPAVTSHFPQEDWKVMLFEAYDYLLDSGYKLSPLGTYFSSVEWDEGLLKQIPYVMEGVRTKEEVVAIYNEYSPKSFIE